MKSLFKIWPLLLAPLILFSIAAVPTGPTQINLAWDYPAADVTPDLVFKLYYSADPALPVAQWAAVATIPGTNRTHRVTVNPGKHFWYITASNFWGESDPSNVALTPAVPRSDTKLSVNRGQ